MVIWRMMAPPALLLADGTTLNLNAFQQVPLRHVSTSTIIRAAEVTAQPNTLVMIVTPGDCSSCFDELDLLSSAYGSCLENGHNPVVIVTNASESAVATLSAGTQGGLGHAYWDVSNQVQAALNLDQTPLKWLTDSTGRIIRAEQGSGLLWSGLVADFVVNQCGYIGGSDAQAH